MRNSILSIMSLQFQQLYGLISGYRIKLLGSIFFCKNRPKYFSHKNVPSEVLQTWTKQVSWSLPIACTINLIKIKPEKMNWIKYQIIYQTISLTVTVCQSNYWTVGTHTESRTKWGMSYKLVPEAKLPGTDGISRWTEPTVASMGFSKHILRN